MKCKIENHGHYDEDICPLCNQGLAVVGRGSRRCFPGITWANPQVDAGDYWHEAEDVRGARCIRCGYVFPQLDEEDRDGEETDADS